MKKPALILSLFALFLTAWAWMTAQGQPANPEDEQAIRKTVDAYAAAFEKGDLDSVMGLYATDAEYIDPAGKSTKGRAAIAALFKKEAANLKGFKLNFHVTSLKVLKSEVALEDGTTELIGPDGSSRKERYSAVWVKTGGKWLITQARDYAGDVDAADSTSYAKLKDLEWLVGTWGAEEKGAAVTVTCRWALNKHFLQQEYAVKTKEGGSATVMTLIGWDPFSGKIKSWVFDSRGGYGEGQWTRQGNSWKVQAIGVLPDGRRASGINTYKHTDDKSYTWQASDREVEGVPVADVEVKFARKAP